MNSDLITRLESAPCGTRELSDEVLRACGWNEVQTGTKSPSWTAPGQWFGTLCPPDCTRSVDDALGLVPEGSITFEASQWRKPPDGEWRWHWALAVGDLEMAQGKAATPALALCAALLRARETDHGC